MDLRTLTISCIAMAAVGCARGDPVAVGPASGAAGARPPDDAAWVLAGTPDERFARVARHLRGLDLAMIEIGHRHAELYWAGQDRNWDYAKYQVGKIRMSLANAVERRPKRAESAKLLEGALLGMDEAIAGKDPALFDARYVALTAVCNACHQVEQFGFAHVEAPTTRATGITAPPQVAPR